MYKISLLVLIFSGCLLMVAIAGAFIPKKVMFWGTEEKKTPGKALVTYGIAAIIFFAGGFGLGEYASAQQKLLPPAITSTSKAESAPATIPTPAPAAVPASPPAAAPKSQQTVKFVEGWKWTHDDTGFDYVRGSVQNVGSRPIRSIEIGAEFKDENGNVLDTERTIIDEVIKPGSQKKFKLMHRTDNKEKKIRIFTQNIKYE